MTTSSAQDSLMSGGAVSCKFANIGDSYTGEVVCLDEVQQKDFTSGDPKTWDNGDPMMQVVITLQTQLRDADDDDGQRALYVKFGSMRTAIRNAVKRAGHKGGMEGGTLTVRFVGTGVPPKKGFHPPKMFEAEFEAPPQQCAGCPDGWTRNVRDAPGSSPRG